MGCGARAPAVRLRSAWAAPEARSSLLRDRLSGRILTWDLSRTFSSGGPPALNWPQVYLAVALTTLATLLLELSLTRIFSVVFYYHFAFLAISIALFGLGAGGLFSYVVAAQRGNIFAKLGTLACTNGFAVILTLGYLLSREGPPDGLTLALIYVTSAVPFFLAGAVISLAIAETIRRVERVYFYDLLGAAGGCLLLIPLLNYVGGPGTVIASAAFFAASAAIWYNLAGKAVGRIGAVALALALVALLVFNVKRGVIEVRHAKGRALTGEQFVKWNSFSRVALAPSPDEKSVRIYVDADASMDIVRLERGKLSDSEKRRLLSQGAGFAYLMRPSAKTLIIGPGGGWDIARALASGSRDVTGVEINPIIANTIMRKRFASLSGNLYLRPEVRIAVEEGRSYIRSRREKYQVIQASLSDTYAASSAGAFALTENTLFTVEAFEDYLEHLEPGGLLSFTRWGSDPPRESIRLAAIGAEALRRAGKTEPWRHILALREASPAGAAPNGERDTVLIFLEPLQAGDIERAAGYLAEGWAETLYLPVKAELEPFSLLLRSTSSRSLEQQYPYDLTPADDNRPFFFFDAKLADWRHYVMPGAGEGTGRTANGAIPLIVRLVGVSLAATAIILVLPPLLAGSRLPRDRSGLRFLAFFAFVGAGYIVIQIALIQRLVGFLGHPTYALTLVIFSMLVSSGIGSYFSRRVVRDSDRRLAGTLAVVGLMVALLAYSLPPMTGVAAGWPLGAKALLTALMLAPVGFLLGIPFPAGLLRLEARSRTAVRWAWSLNAAASVLGSTLALCAGIFLGLRETLLLGALLYALAGVAIPGALRGWQVKAETAAAD